MKLIIMITIAMFATIGLSTKTIAGNNKDVAPKSMMDIIHNILEDPEYLALDSQRQLRVLITVYEILESHYKRLHTVEQKKTK
jgi:hypothetical protein